MKISFPDEDWVGQHLYGRIQNTFLEVLKYLKKSVIVISDCYTEYGNEGGLAGSKIEFVFQWLAFVVM